MATYTYQISFVGNGEISGNSNIGTINSNGGSRYFTIEQGHGINLYPRSLYKSNFVEWRVYYPSKGYRYYYELKNTVLWISEDNMVIEAIFSSPLVSPSIDMQSNKFYHNSSNYLGLNFSNFDEGVFLINSDNNSTISSLAVYDGWSSSGSGWGIQFGQPRILKKSDYTSSPVLSISFKNEATEGNPNIINYIWKPNNFTITYDANGGTSTPSEMIIEPGTSITLPAKLSRDDSYISSSTDFAITFQSSYAGVSWSSKTINPSKTTKYTFYKWYDGTDWYDANYTGYTPTGNTTFSAGWATSSTYSVTAPNISRSEKDVSRIITFDSNGGDLTISEAEQIGIRKYTLRGWYDDTSGSNLIVGDQQSYNPTGTQTLYGLWKTSTTYNTITFPTGTRDGYTLLGFSTNSAAKQADSGCTPGASKAVSSTTYYAIWSLNDYTLSYDMNGGSGTIEEQTGSASYTISSTRPTRIGWNFDGWATNKNAAASYSPGGNISLSEDTVLYAIWSQKTISSGSSVNTVISYDGQKYWYTFTPSSTGKYVIYSTGSADTYAHLYNTAETQLATNNNSNSNFNFRLEYDLTGGTTYYYAVRYSNSSKTGTIATHFGPVYTIQYDSKGGASTPEDQSKDWGTTIQITSDEILKAGYEFKGWSTSSTATTVNYVPGADFTSNANRTLYAVWKPINYTISYTLDNGTVSPANKTSYTIETPNFTLNNPTKTGHTFTGWSGTDLTGESNETVTILTGSVGDREYIAHWAINSHQFTLGTATHINTLGSTTSGVKDYGTVIILKATVDAGYEFAGWTSSNTNLVSNLSAADTSFNMPDGAITMTPSVKAKSYTITYDIKTNANSESDLSNKPSDTTYSYTGETVKITSTIPKQIGYTFTGWCRNSNSTSDLLSSGATIDQATNNITLYAVWEKNIEITYDINEGTGATPTKQSTTVYNKSAGTSFNSLDNGSGFVKEGYKFIGWSTTKNDSSTQVSTSTIFTTSTTLYALWEIQYYSLTTNIYTNSSDSDYGNSISSPTLISGSTQSGKYAYGSVIKLTATAVDPYDFESWSQNGIDKGSGDLSDDGNKSECNFTITEDTIIIANFAKGSISARFYCYDITSGSPSEPELSTTSKVKLWVRSKAETASTYGAWEKKSFSTKMTYSDSTYIQVLIENGEEYEFNSGSGINFAYTIPDQLTDILIKSDEDFSIPCKKIKTENHIKVNDVLKTSGYIKDPYFSMNENIASIWIGDKQIMGRAPSKIYPYKEDSLLIDTLYINNKNYKFNKSYQNNTAIKKVIIPQNITEIRSNDLDGCSNIRTVKFLQDSQLTSLGNYCFRNNSNLLKIYFPDKLSNIGSGALWGCTRLQKVILPKTILTIQREAFYDCSNLQSLKLNHTKITKLPYGIFSNCFKLKTIFLPKTLTTIENYVFYRCDSLEKIIYMGTIEDWNKITIASQGNKTYLDGVPIQCIDGITYI